MNFKAYLFQEAGKIFFSIFFFLLSSFYLYLTGTSLSILLLLFCFFSLTFISYFILSYHKKKKKCERLDVLLDSLKDPTLFSEILEKPEEIIEKKYYEILKRAMKVSLDRMKEIEREKKAYQEYIEEWVHEIKTPIAGMSLICENHDFSKKKEIIGELFSMEALVEQVLFYARSEKTEKDYVIKSVPLEELVHASLMRYKNILLEEKIEVETSNLSFPVYTDPKWTVFIMDQIMSNAIKYRKDKNCKIKIYGISEKGQTILCIEDKGIGISESELPRVFDKGFTGEARNKKNATGMGLYLSKKLCDKLGHTIKIESKKNQYTRTTLFFPIGNMHKF